MKKSNVKTQIEKIMGVRREYKGGENMLSKSVEIANIKIENDQKKKSLRELITGGFEPAAANVAETTF